MKLVSFSNKRPAVEQGSFLTASQTEGKLRITGVAAALLGVIEGDYVAVGSDVETGKMYVYAGVKDAKNQVGNKLTSTGQTFEFGSQNAWEEVGGTTNHSVRYKVSETPVEFDGMKLFELTDKEDLPRSTRTRKDGTIADPDEQEEGDVRTENGDVRTENGGGDTVAPQIEAEEAGFSLD